MMRFDTFVANDNSLSNYPVDLLLAACVLYEEILR